jgi:hypothetical protein
MSRTSKLLLGVLASMMVWSLVGADELDLAKQQDRVGFGPAARQVVDAQALQSVGARCRAETDAAVAAAVAAAADAERLRRWGTRWLRRRRRPRRLRRQWRVPGAKRVRRRRRRSKLPTARPAPRSQRA